MNLSAAESNKKAVREVNSIVSKLKSSDLKCVFTLVYYDARQDGNDIQKGECILSGKKLYINMNGIETFFDGKTQWIYMLSNNEVTISEPTPQEMNEISPISMLDYYMEDHSVNFDSREDSQYNIINFFPDDRTVEYFKITLKAGIKSNLPVQLIIWQRNGDTITFNWESIEKVETTKETFMFQQNKYPNVELNDLR
jgi:hypothetical protein